MKLTHHISSIITDFTEDVIMRFNSAKQIIDVITSSQSFSYQYNGNEVIVRSGGNDAHKIALDNGRAVNIITIDSKDVQKISYDSDGRMKQILLEHEGVVRSISTFFYAGGNLDYVLVEIKDDERLDSKYIFEYTNFKTDARTQSFQFFNESILGNFVPVTLRGSSSFNLPSKMIYVRKINNYDYKYATVYEYTYTMSPANGSVIGMSTKYTVQTKGGPIVITDNVNIASTCP
ncbi:hypothetical protein [Pedobacter sp. V48]|uniref:hypothetical protein n=1 Tax=Pedobacter sp. V48 TaxID=509635 RepID=UPI001268CF1D|nr:hypothetical protein [Pedobacter sp. V48]